MDMKTLLDNEIEAKFKELESLDPGSKEYAAAVDSISKLMDRRLEIKRQESSEAQAEKQMVEDRMARIVKNLIDLGGIVLPLAVTIWGALLSFTFEEKGTICSSIGRKFMDKLIKR